MISLAPDGFKVMRNLNILRLHIRCERRLEVNVTKTAGGMRCKRTVRVG